MKKLLLLVLPLLLLGANVSTIKKIPGDGILVQARDGTTTIIKSSPTLPLTLSSANYTILPSDNYDTILVVTGNSDRTITLPAVSSGVGRKLFVKKTDSGTGRVIIDTPGAETVDGSAQFTLTYQYAWVSLVGDGTNWQFLGGLDEGAFTATFTQAGGYSQAVSVKATKVGHLVNLQIPSFSATATANAPILSGATDIPSGFRPTAESRFFCVYASTGVQTGNGGIYFTTGGQIQLYVSIVGNNYTSGAANSGFGAGDAGGQSFSYKTP